MIDQDTKDNIINITIFLILVFVILFYYHLRIKKLERKIEDIHKGIIEVHGELYLKYMENK